MFRSYGATLISYSTNYQWTKTSINDPTPIPLIPERRKQEDLVLVNIKLILISRKNEQLAQSIRLLN